MATSSYADALARNVRAARARRGLRNADVIERMRSLGYTNWYQQTFSKIQRGERRLMADEIFGLAWALEINMSALLGGDADAIALGGIQIAGYDVTALAYGRNTGAVRWDGNKPLFDSVVDAA